jgi:endonuclease-3
MVTDQESQSFTETVYKKLNTHFGEVKCPLNYTKSYELGIAVILSAQCTDERVNTVTPELFAKYTTLESFAKADLKDIEDIIFSTGFFKNKAKAIKGYAQKLLTEYNSKLPSNINELTTLPGVGRKTANVILNEIFGVAEGIVVDTHVKRISKKLGITRESNPEKIELELMRKIKKKYWHKFSLYLISLGRKFCKANKTDCEHCPLGDKVCPSSKSLK